MHGEEQGVELGEDASERGLKTCGSEVVVGEHGGFEGFRDFEGAVKFAYEWVIGA